MRPLAEDGSDAIPDLVLSRTLETAENKYEHLVVELKRPAHMLKSADIEQLRSYAVAVAEDDRFQQPNVRWTYILIGNPTNRSVDEQRVQLDQPYGRVQITKRYSIWVRNWSEVIGDAQHRHKFVQQSLDYTTDHDTGVRYLREKHRQYLPDAMLPPEETPEVRAAGVPLRIGRAVGGQDDGQDVFRQGSPVANVVPLALCPVSYVPLGCVRSYRRRLARPGCRSASRTGGRVRHVCFARTNHDA